MKPLYENYLNTIVNTAHEGYKGNWFAFANSAMQVALAYGEFDDAKEIADWYLSKSDDQPTYDGMLKIIEAYKDDEPLPFKISNLKFSEIDGSLFLECNVEDINIVDEYPDIRIFLYALDENGNFIKDKNTLDAGLPISLDMIELSCDSKKSDGKRKWDIKEYIFHLDDYPDSLYIGCIEYLSENDKYFASSSLNDKYKNDYSLFLKKNNISLAKKKVSWKKKLKTIEEEIDTDSFYSLAEEIYDDMLSSIDAVPAKIELIKKEHKRINSVIDKYLENDSENLNDEIKAKLAEIKGDVAVALADIITTHYEIKVSNKMHESTTNDSSNIIKGKKMINITHKMIYEMPLITDAFGTVVRSNQDGVEFTLENLSNKTIKYATVHFMGLNRVGDLINNKQEKFQIVGPLNPGSFGHVKTAALWQNRLVNSIVIFKVEVDYMDGYKYVWDLQEHKDSSNPLEEIKPSLNQTSSSGCYVATCVYGSYDCPEVWTLRRFRDDILSKTWYGRMFIKTYYAVSPTIVKWFGETSWFKNIWKPTLDKMVYSLNEKGVENTSYVDKNY